MTQLDVETPAPVVDLDRLERNLSRWQQRCDELGLANRPHLKTHKSVAIARRQLELGAVGLTCQTLGEAEMMADAGFLDLLVPTNVIGERKLARLAGLLERAEVTVAVDDARVLPGLAAAAPLRQAAADPRRVRHRQRPLSESRRPSDAADARRRGRELALPRSLRRLHDLPGPRGHARSSSSVRSSWPAATARSETDAVSAGGTPAMWSAGELRPTVTEYRAGTYAFHDRATIAAGAATLDDAALTVCATVVSRPAQRRAIIDAGVEVALLRPLSPPRRLRTDARGARLALVKLDEEHGYVELATADALELGQQVRIVPEPCLCRAEPVRRARLVRDGTLVGPLAGGREGPMIGTIGEGLYELGVDEGNLDGPPRQGFGGDVANTAVMAAKLGKARLCARVGDDALGRLLLDFWRASGVDTHW